MIVVAIAAEEGQGTLRGRMAWASRVRRAGRRERGMFGRGVAAGDNEIAGDKEDSGSKRAERMAASLDVRETVWAVSGRMAVAVAISGLLSRALVRAFWPTDLSLSIVYLYNM